MSTFTKRVVSEREYKPLYDKYGKNRCCQWEVMTREKCALNEAGYIAKLIKQYSQLKFGSAMAMKNMVKKYKLKQLNGQQMLKYLKKI